MDAALRRIFEQWGLIRPTTLGFCSAGLCIAQAIEHYEPGPLKAKEKRSMYGRAKFDLLRMRVLRAA